MDDLLSTISAAVGAPQRPAAPSSASDPMMQISPEVQKQRDQERLGILNDELASQQDPGNRAALQREISRTQSGIQGSAQPAANGDPNAFNANAIIQAVGGADKSISDMSDAEYAKWAAEHPSAGTVEISGAAGQQAPSLADKVIGAGEAGLSVLSAIPAAVPGAIAAVSNIATNGKLGTQEGVREAADRFHDVAGAYTYEPRTDTGKEYLANVGNAINDSGVIGLAPVAEVGALAGAKSANAISDLKQKFTDKGSSVDRIEPTLTDAAKPRIKLNTDGTQTVLSPTAPVESPVAYNQPKMAQASPELVKEIEKSKGGLNQTAIDRHLEADTLPVPMQLTKGQATGDIHQISFEQNNRGKNPDIGDRLNAQNGQLIQNMDAIRTKAAPDVTAVNHVESGQSLIDAYKKMDAPVNAEITANYKALKDANGGHFPLDGKTFVDNADAALHKELLYHEVPAGLRKTLDGFRDGNEMTFENFESLRTNLARIQRSQTADGNIKAAAGTIRNALEELPMPPGAEHLKPLADKARASAKARFDRIAADPAYKAAINDGVGIGEASPLADKFIESHVVNGKRANVQNMVSNLADDPLAKQTIAAGTLDYLKHSSGVDLRTNTGNVSQASYNKALTKITPKSDLLFDPETSQQTQQLGNVARYTQEQPKGSYVNNSNTLVGSLASGAKELTLGALNIKTLGTSNFIRNQLKDRSLKKSIGSALEPGAGIKLSDFPK